MAKLKNDINPALAAHKAAKNKSIKKGKADVQAQRNERLGKQNPERIQRQIDELRESGDLRPQDRQKISDLEKSLKSVEKARKALGERAPEFRPLRDFKQDGDRGGALGKRKREHGQDRHRDDQKRDGEESSETEEDVRKIPWPKDVENIQPIPRRQNQRSQPDDAGAATNKLPEKPAQPVVARTTYSGSAQLRDIQQDAVNAFLPQHRKPAVPASETTMSTEDKAQAEADGLTAAKKAADAAEKEAEFNIMAGEAAAGGPSADLDEELMRIEQELIQVENEDDDVPADGSVADLANKVVNAAIEEAEFTMMADEAKSGPAKTKQEEEKRAEGALRGVYVEDVSDEDV